MTLKVTDNQYGPLSERQLGFLFNVKQQTFPVERMLPANLVDEWRRRIVNTDLDLVIALKLFDLSQTLTITVLIEQHRTLNSSNQTPPDFI